MTGSVHDTDASSRDHLGGSWSMVDSSGSEPTTPRPDSPTKGTSSSKSSIPRRPSPSPQRGQAATRALAAPTPTFVVPTRERQGHPIDHPNFATGTQETTSIFSNRPSRLPVPRSLVTRQKSFNTDFGPSVLRMVSSGSEVELPGLPALPKRKVSVPEVTNVTNDHQQLPLQHQDHRGHKHTYSDQGCRTMPELNSLSTDAMSDRGRRQGVPDAKGPEDSSNKWLADGRAPTQTVSPLIFDPELDGYDVRKWAPGVAVPASSDVRGDVFQVTSPSTGQGQAEEDDTGEQRSLYLQDNKDTLSCDDGLRFNDEHNAEYQKPQVTRHSSVLTESASSMRCNSSISSASFRDSDGGDAHVSKPNSAASERLTSPHPAKANAKPPQGTRTRSSFAMPNSTLEATDLTFEVYKAHMDEQEEYESSVSGVGEEAQGGDGLKLGKEGQQSGPFSKSVLDLNASQDSYTQERKEKTKAEKREFTSDLATTLTLLVALFTIYAFVKEGERMA